MENNLDNLSFNLKKTPGEKIGLEKLSPEETKDIIGTEVLGELKDTNVVISNNRKNSTKHRPHHTKKTMSKDKKKVRKAIAKASKRRNRKRK
jgi:hypothetical protein